LVNFNTMFVVAVLNTVVHISYYITCEY